MPSIGERIFGYSKRELEDKVDHFIRRRPFLGPRPPIEADLIIKRMRDVKRIEVAENLLTKYRVEAMVLTPQFMHRDLTVVINQELMNRRDGAPYNMALAEEIGHIELHRAVVLEIEEPEDFCELTRHPRWQIAEHDAKYFGRALLMPRVMLEVAARDAYVRVASEVGFADPFRFDRIFTIQLAREFEIPLPDAQKRIDSYVGGLRIRLDRSVAAGTGGLLELGAELMLASRPSTHRENSHDDAASKLRAADDELEPPSAW